jgi:hypothetical protein
MSSRGFSQAGAPMRMAYQSHWWHRFVNNIIQKKFHAGEKRDFSTMDTESAE